MRVVMSYSLGNSPPPTFVIMHNRAQSAPHYLVRIVHANVGLRTRRRSPFAKYAFRVTWDLSSCRYSLPQKHEIIKHYEPEEHHQQPVEPQPLRPADQQHHNHCAQDFSGDDVS